MGECRAVVGVLLWERDSSVLVLTVAIGHRGQRAEPREGNKWEVVELPKVIALNTQFLLPGTRVDVFSWYLHSFTCIIAADFAKTMFGLVLSCSDDQRQRDAGITTSPLAYLLSRNQACIFFKKNLNFNRQRASSKAILFLEILTGMLI